MTYKKLYDIKIKAMKRKAGATSDPKASGGGTPSPTKQPVTGTAAAPSKDKQ